MKKRSLLSAALCVTMGMGLLTGCGGKNPEPAEPAAGQGAKTEAAKDQSAESGGDEVIELKFASWEASELESAAIQSAIDGFEATHPNIKVKYSVNPFNEHHAKLNTQMASGDAPDVFFMNPEYQRDFIRRGQLLDITDMLGDYVDVDDYLPSSLEKMRVKVDGQERIFGVDCCIVGPVIFYNRDLFDKAGVEYIPTKAEDQWTWDEFVENMKKLTVVENGNTIQYGTSNFEEEFNLYTTLELLGSNGAKWFNDDYTEAVGIDSEATRDALNKIRDLRTVQGVAPNPTAVGLDNSNSPTQMFLTGQVASIYIGSYALQQLAQSDINLGAGLPPKMAEGTKPIGSANIDCIWSGTKYPKESLELVMYLTSLDAATPIYKTGLWMPNRLSMYQEDKLAEWFDREIYPEGWEDMMWLWTEAEGRWFDHLHNTDKIYDTCSEYMQEFFYSDGDPEEILPQMQKEVNALLKE